MNSNGRPLSRGVYFFVFARTALFRELDGAREREREAEGRIKPGHQPLWVLQLCVVP